MSARCDECGKFRKSADVEIVYTGGPTPEPDHYACADGCKGDDRG